MMLVLIYSTCITFSLICSARNSRGFVPRRDWQAYLQTLEKGVDQGFLCGLMLHCVPIHILFNLQDGRTPAIIFSMPHNEHKLISISANDATNMVSTILRCPLIPSPLSIGIRTLQVRIHGRMGLAAQRFFVNLGDEQLPVLVRGHDWKLCLS